MRTGAPAGRSGFFHEAVFYSSDSEFLSTVVPFLEGGLEAGEPTVVALGPGTRELVRTELGDTAGIIFDGAGDADTRPARLIASYAEFFAAQTAGGAQQIRVVGEIPHPGLGVPWDWWARYEATINRAFAGFPVWGLCPYDMRTTPDPVLGDVARTHPQLATIDGEHLDNARYRDPVKFLTRRPPAGPDPLEVASAPLVELLDPTPGAARRAARDVGRLTDLDPTEVDNLVVAVNEVVTNALSHGLPPVRLRLWAAPGRMVATVSDGGDGPTDPFAGLLPGTGAAAGGLGLWVVHQVCSHVMFDRTSDGFTLRLVAGTAMPERDGHGRGQG
jgi:anti-sigma regulatory factor (Ser/Thr protein kinase)